MLITLWVFTGIEGAVVLSSCKNRHDIGKATILGVLLALVLRDGHSIGLWCSEP